MQTCTINLIETWRKLFNPKPRININYALDSQHKWTPSFFSARILRKPFKELKDGANSPIETKRQAHVP